MTDETLDPRFERDLRAVLAAAEPAAAPASLYASVAAVPLRAPARRAWTGRRMAFAGLAMAAVVLVAVAALALALRPWGDQPIIGGPSASPATPSAEPGQGIVLTYRVLPGDGVQPGPKDIEAVIAVLQDRIGASLGTTGSISAKGADEIAVGVTLDVANDAAVSGLRQLLGTTGHLDFVPLGDTPASEGETVDLVAHPPLFSGDQVASASVSADQTGGRAVDLTLRSEGARLFAEYTTANVGTYFAIVLDGRVISTPAITSAIPNGEVQISQGGIGGDPLAEAHALAAIAQSGELPFPVQELSMELVPEPSGAVPVTTPTEVASTDPSPSSGPSPSAAAAARLIAAARAYADDAGFALAAAASPQVGAERPDTGDAFLTRVALPPHTATERCSGSGPTTLAGSLWST